MTPPSQPGGRKLAEEAIPHREGRDETLFAAIVGGVVDGASGIMTVLGWLALGVVLYVAAVVVVVALCRSAARAEKQLMNPRAEHELDEV